MDTFIGKRLKELRDRKNIKMPAIAKETGIPKENLYKWEKGTRPSDINEYNKLKDYLDKLDSQPDNLLAEPQPVYRKSLNQPTKSLLVSIFLTDDNSELYTDEKAVPGSVITINGKPALIAYNNDSPLIGEVDGLISVPDESMEPRYKSGSWIAIKKLKFTRIINAGYYYYIIDKNNEALLRKVRPGGENNSITLLSENEAVYPEITRSMDEILAIFSVKAVLIK